MDRAFSLISWTFRLVAAYLLLNFAASFWFSGYPLVTRLVVLVGYAAFAVCVLWFLEGLIRRARVVLLTTEARNRYDELVKDVSNLKDSLPRDGAKVVSGFGQNLNIRYVAVAGAVLVAMFVGWAAVEAANSRKVAKNLTVLTATSGCASWIGKEFNDRQYSDPATATGTWEKHGHIVVEVAWKNDWTKDSYTSRLCVYDPVTGRMESPGAFGRSKWERF
ncbi:hypothetical protein [Ruegeria arenilitoris]|uniref:hypothetical protein n=1 Tax=Ruegeria arenilitoris TaxID=1173585 RepID=UPI00147C3F8D|nr:hypothetical protein [Ruegeria arenilitoris]